MFVDGLSEWVVRTPREVYELMMRGAEQVGVTCLCMCVWGGLSICERSEIFVMSRVRHNPHYTLL